MEPCKNCGKDPCECLRCEHGVLAEKGYFCGPCAVEQPKAGVKFDTGRAPVASLFLAYFPRATMAVANVGEYGARKYTPGGWLTVPDGVPRYSDALGRHLLKEAIEGRYDDGDSGLSHAAQVAWNALARLELMLREGLVEDRRGNEIVGGKPVLGTAKAA